MKETVVPNRNKIFASLIQAVALSIATKGEKQQVEIAMGIHAGDHAIYPDCRQEFRDADMEAFKIGNWDSELVIVTTPYLDLNKFDILEDGLKSCEKLRLDFDEIYKRTNTSYKPIKLLENYWVSDFKSAASVERVEAFIKLGRPDPVQYGELLENGDVRTVKWEEVKQRVQEVLDAHNS
jgi:7-cyano-7-deazaguanine synthase